MCTSPDKLDSSARQCPQSRMTSHVAMPGNMTITSPGTNLRDDIALHTLPQKRKQTAGRRDLNKRWMINPILPFGFNRQDVIGAGGGGGGGGTKGGRSSSEKPRKNEKPTIQGKLMVSPEPSQPTVARG